MADPYKDPQTLINEWKAAEQKRSAQARELKAARDARIKAGEERAWSIPWTEDPDADAVRAAKERGREYGRLREEELALTPEAQEAMKTMPSSEESPAASGPHAVEMGGETDPYKKYFSPRVVSFDTWKKYMQEHAADPRARGPKESWGWMVHDVDELSDDELEEKYRRYLDMMIMRRRSTPPSSKLMS